MDGALTVQPMGASRTPARNASASSMQSPPASADCHQRHHLVAGVGSAWGATQVQVPVNQLGQAQMPGPAWRAGSAQHWPPGGGRQRRFGCGRGGHLIASFGCSWPGDGLVLQKPLSPMDRSTFLPLQHTATLIFSVDWGLGCGRWVSESGLFISGGLASRWLVGGGAPVYSVEVQLCWGRIAPRRDGGNTVPSLEELRPLVELPMESLGVEYKDWLDLTTNHGESDSCQARGRFG